MRGRRGVGGRSAGAGSAGYVVEAVLGSPGGVAWLGLRGAFHCLGGLSARRRSKSTKRGARSRMVSQFTATAVRRIPPFSGESELCSCVSWLHRLQARCCLAKNSCKSGATFASGTCSGPKPVSRGRTWGRPKPVIGPVASPGGRSPVFSIFACFFKLFVRKWVWGKFFPPQAASRGPESDVPLSRVAGAGCQIGPAIARSLPK